jgi:hypothetical protein
MLVGALRVRCFGGAAWCGVGGSRGASSECRLALPPAAAGLAGSGHPPPTVIGQPAGRSAVFLYRLPPSLPPSLPQVSSLAGLDSQCSGSALLSLLGWTVAMLASTGVPPPLFAAWSRRRPLLSHSSPVCLLSFILEIRTHARTHDTE